MSSAKEREREGREVFYTEELSSGFPDNRSGFF